LQTEHGLPDIIEPGLRLLICGTAVSTTSAARRHYYSNVRNGFWRLLHESGLVPDALRPQDDRRLPEYGIGLTDLAPGIAQNHDRGLNRHFDLAGFIGKVEEFAPTWVGLHGPSGAGRAVARYLSHGQPRLGEQQWRVASARVFVLPSASSANAQMPYDEKLRWWRQLATLAG
jgi:double-stranded uracil-DNA glycosylase